MDKQKIRQTTTDECDGFKMIMVTWSTSWTIIYKVAPTEFDDKIYANIPKTKLFPADTARHLKGFFHTKRTVGNC